jgi:cytochrome oxidase assembly protein ShyY1
VRKIATATILGIALIYGCIQGSMWQYDRYQVRHANNELIKDNTKKPSLTEAQLLDLGKNEAAWRLIELEGSFLPEKELLLRNRYHDGKYGFGVVTLFKSDSDILYWVDRGWVIAGATAQTPPITQNVTTERTSIIARVRVEDIENQIKGSVFAAPGVVSNQLQKWNSQEQVSTSNVYLDLLSSDVKEFTPKVPAMLPEISDGPHLAYSFQWLIFALLVVLAWFLVVREERKAQTEKL